MLFRSDRSFDFSAARVTASIDESLARLGVDHVDIVQCHDIEFVPLQPIVDETLPALRRAVEAGKARFVGITGLPPALIMSGGAAVKPAPMPDLHFEMVDTLVFDGLLRLQADRAVR